MDIFLYIKKFVYKICPNGLLGRIEWRKNMCVALPGKVIKLNGSDAVIDFNGNQLTAKTGLVEIELGDYCLVHAGCILQKVEADEAKKLAALMEEIEAFT